MVDEYQEPAQPDPGSTQGRVPEGRGARKAASAGARGTQNVQYTGGVNRVQRAQKLASDAQYSSPENAAAARKRRRGGRLQHNTDTVSALRFALYTALLLGLIIFGISVLSPSFSVFFEQRQRIAQMESEIADTRQKIKIAEQERERWRDPAYIRAQARDRLFYVMPGESQLGIIKDIEIPKEIEEEPSATLSQENRSWTNTLLFSLLQANEKSEQQALPQDEGSSGNQQESNNEEKESSGESSEESDNEN